MKLLFTADIHIHPHRIGSADGGQDRLADGLRALRQVYELARKHEVPLIIAGDIKMPKSYWPQDAQNGLIFLFNEFKDVETFLIPGNHDGASPRWATGVLPFANQVHIVQIPAIQQIHPALSVAFWPHGFSADHLPEFLVRAQGQKAKLLVAHAFLAGALLGPDETRLPGKGYTLEQFGIGSVFEYAVFGDIHKAQYLQRVPNRPVKWLPFDGSEAVSVKGSVLYPGSPYQQSWGERNEAVKGPVLLDTERGTARLLPITSPRFLLYDLTGQPDGIEKLFEKFKSRKQDWWEDQIVRIVPGQEITPSRLKILEEMRALGNPRIFDVMPYEAPPADARTEIHAGLSPEAMMTEYTTVRGLEGFPRAKLLEAGMRLFKST